MAIIIYGAHGVPFTALCYHDSRRVDALKNELSLNYTLQ